jgi:hypothetical protein
MKGLRIFAGLLATVFIVIGFLFAINDPAVFGPAVLLPGSVILSAVLIMSAILDRA